MSAQPDNLTASFDTFGDHPPFEGWDELILIDGGLINEGGSLNLAYLAELITSTGNAQTSAIANTSMAWLFGTDEEGGGGDGDSGGGGYGGWSSENGGLIVSW